MMQAGRKRSLEDDDDAASSRFPPSTRPRLQGGEKHNNLSEEQRVAVHYSSRPNQSVEQREASPIIHLKKLNNWIKSVLIQLHTRPGDSVLDLACGKGGDLIKWDKARIGYYVGTDIATGSIEDARDRYNNATDHASRRKPFLFPARLIRADCFKVPLTQYLEKDGPFDICSCQFALHYSWSTEQRARRALENVSGLLKPGGYFIGTIPDANVIVKKLREAEGLEFGNSVYHIKFSDRYAQKVFKPSERFGIEYEFHLEDAVDCPEWLVHFPSFKALAEEYGLRLLWKKNCHEFVHEHVKHPDFAELMRRIGALSDGAFREGISADEWSISYIYLAFAFQKEGQAPPHNRNNPRRTAAQIRKEDILDLDE